MAKQSAIIHFFHEDVHFELKGKRNIRLWIEDAIRKENKDPGSLNFIFCSDSYLHRMNVEYLEHDTYTDIITFDLSELENEVSGDVFISHDRAKDNARTLGHRTRDEIDRLIIHGVLHLVGYGDKAPDDKARMTEKEDYYLSLRP